LSLNVKQLQQLTDGISKDILERSKIKDVCKLLDLKASSKYVDSKLAQQTSEMT